MSKSNHEPIDLGPMTMTFMVTADDSNGSATLSRCDVNDGAGLPVAHSHDAFEETIYGLEGVTTFSVDGEDVEIGPGDSVCIKRGAVHTFQANAGDTSFLAVATPGLFGPDYFYDIQEVVKAAAGGPPDPGAMAQVMLRHGLTPVPPPVS